MGFTSDFFKNHTEYKFNELQKFIIIINSFFVLRRPLAEIFKNEL